MVEKQGRMNEMNWTFETQAWEANEAVFQSDEEDDGDDGDEYEEDGYEEENEDEESQDLNTKGIAKVKDSTAQAREAADSGTTYPRDAMTIQIPDTNFTTWAEELPTNIRTCNSANRRTPPTMYTDSHMLYDNPLGFGKGSSSQYPSPGGRYFPNQDHDSMSLGMPYAAYGKFLTPDLPQ